MRFLTDTVKNTFKTTITRISAGVLSAALLSTSVNTQVWADMTKEQYRTDPAGDDETGADISSDTDDPSITKANTADHALAVVYDELYREEKLWASNLKNLSGTPALEDMYYTDFTTKDYDGKSEEVISADGKSVNIETYAKNHNLTYVPQSSWTNPNHYQYRKDYGIKGPKPFDDAPDAAYKWIKKMDGGQNVRFVGATGQNSLTSNIQEIVAMAMVAQTQTDRGNEDDVDDDSFSYDESLWSSFLDNMNQFITSVRDFFMGTKKDGSETGVDEKWIKTWWKTHQDEKEALAYMNYAKPLFDQSHREGYSLQVSLLPTKWTTKVVANTYTTTQGYTSGEVSTIFPGTMTSNSISDAEYNQMKKNSAAFFKKQKEEGKGDGIVNVKASESQLDLITKTMAHETYGPSTKDFDRSASASVAECMRNWIIDASITKTHLNAPSWEKAVQIGLRDSSGSLLKVIQNWKMSRSDYAILYSIAQNICDGTEYVTGNQYAFWWRGQQPKNFTGGYLTVLGGNGVWVYTHWYPNAKVRHTTYAYKGYEDSSIRIKDKDGQNVAANANATVLTVNQDGTVSTDGTIQSASGSSTGRTTNVSVCTGDDDDSAELADFDSQGFGCMTYDKFFFKDANSTDLYYDKNETSVNDAVKVSGVASEAYVKYSQEVGGTPYMTDDSTSSDTDESGDDTDSSENSSANKSIGTATGGPASSTGTDTIDASYNTDTFNQSKDGKINWSVEELGKKQYLVDSDHRYIKITDRETNKYVKLNDQKHYIVHDEEGYRYIVEDDRRCLLVDDYDKPIKYDYQKNAENGAASGQSDPGSSSSSDGKQTSQDIGSVINSDNAAVTVDSDDQVNDEMRSSYDHKYVCVAPKGDISLFADAIHAYPDCWDVEIDDDETRIDTDNKDDYKSLLVSDADDAIKSKAGGYGNKIMKLDGDSSYIHAYKDGDGEKYYIYVMTDGPQEHRGHKHTDGTYGKDYYVYYKKIVFTHNCKGGHRGYYCGGHLLIDTTGIIYHMTEDEKNNREDVSDKTNYVNKMRQNEDGDWVINREGTANFNKKFSDTIVDKFDKNATDVNGIKNYADDLFDIDLCLEHKKSGINVDFDGWTASNIESAANKLLDDWQKLYGIHVENSLSDTLDSGPISDGDYTPSTDTSGGSIDGKTISTDFSKIKNYDFKAMLQKLKDSDTGSRKNFSKYLSSNAIKITTVNDPNGNSHEFWEEFQTGQPAWYNVKGWNGVLRSKESSVNQRGCFMYAAAIAVTNLTGKIYLSADAVAACSTAGSWSFDDSAGSGGAFVINGRNKYGSSVVGWESGKLQNILDDGTGGQYKADESDRIKGSLSNYPQLVSDIINGKKTALIWAVGADSGMRGYKNNATPRLMSSSKSSHWTYIAGGYMKNGEAHVYVLGNGGRCMDYKVSQLGNLEHIFTISKK